ncbi:hypothetical protein GALMADRAFT_143911 [Galerina marginata CBS 339.88]|uniref:Uncharacterized protein n=1 Tax=Galerina marginata (strain CBS 339.88) TaxID=685588 RepID=A0A067SVD7_GALM3|nr:hypothetical protein GALMADRAFT_143911 [Galerina marginata CBS 339.88]
MPSSSLVRICDRPSVAAATAVALSTSSPVLSPTLGNRRHAVPWLEASTQTGPTYHPNRPCSRTAAALSLSLSFAGHRWYQDTRSISLLVLVPCSPCHICCGPATHDDPHTLTMVLDVDDELAARVEHQGAAIAMSAAAARGNQQLRRARRFHHHPGLQRQRRRKWGARVAGR